MNFLYFDCFSGVSGDMLVSALIDLGVDLKRFEEEMERLGLELSLSCQDVVFNGIKGTQFFINNTQSKTYRHLPEIRKIINNSSLKPSIKEKSLQVFIKLANAEASVHSISPEKIHFHEIGAIDTIVDIVGTFICLDLLGIEHVYSSPLPWSRGYIDISHGRYPLPAPATALLLKGIPCQFCSEEMELVTPTGAALITSMTSSFGPLPDCIPLEIAYGSGSKPRSDGVPNLLRVILASPYNNISTVDEMVGVLETQVDDLSPEIVGYLFDLFFKDADVLDFYTTPVFMKKNRPGVLLTLITRPQAIKRLADILLTEAGTLGVRHRLQSRSLLARQHDSIETTWGSVRVKVAHLPGGDVRIKPEFEDCRAIASAHNLSLQEVYLEVSKILSKSI